jgi:hypothetical protein
MPGDKKPSFSMVGSLALLLYHIFNKIVDTKAMPTGTSPVGQLSWLSGAERSEPASLPTGTYYKHHTCGNIAFLSAIIHVLLTFRHRDAKDLNSITVL